jgi:hypothetical protein
MLNGQNQVTSKRSSQRFSTYSGAPSFALSDKTTSTTSTGDTRMAEIKEWTQGLDRLESKPLQQQRYVPSAQKSEDLSKLALGAKLDRALGRRMTGQDAVFRKKKPLSEKTEQTAST